MFPEILRGGLWHTTSIKRFNSILKSGFILPNPEIPESERWCTKLGPPNYPYVRTLNGISIFDFRGFDESQYTEEYPCSNWRYFVPCCKKWDSAIWVNLSFEKIKEGFIDPNKLLEEWKEKKAYRNNIMPLIEAAHIGPISVDAFSRVFKYSEQTQKFMSCSLHNMAHLRQ